MSDHDPLRSLVLELALAVGMIACLVGAMFIHTGSMPPLVVVESKSMIHEEGGEIGSIDAGDLDSRARPTRRYHRDFCRSNRPFQQRLRLRTARS